jgi:hypothetical protein
MHVYLHNIIITSLIKKWISSHHTTFTLRLPPNLSPSLQPRVSFNQHATILIARKLRVPLLVLRAIVLHAAQIADVALDLVEALYELDAEATRCEEKSVFVSCGNIKATCQYGMVCDNALLSISCFSHVIYVWSLTKPRPRIIRLKRQHQIPLSRQRRRIAPYRIIHLQRRDIAVPLRTLSLGQDVEVVAVQMDRVGERRRSSGLLDDLGGVSCEFVYVVHITQYCHCRSVSMRLVTAYVVCGMRGEGHTLFFSPTSRTCLRGLNVSFPSYTDCSVGYDKSTSIALPSTSHCTRLPDPAVLVKPTSSLSGVSCGTSVCAYGTTFFSSLQPVFKGTGAVALLGLFALAPA